jgi:hypothetical protein
VEVRKSLTIKASVRDAKTEEDLAMTRLAEHAAATSIENKRLQAVHLNVPRNPPEQPTSSEPPPTRSSAATDRNRRSIEKSGAPSFIPERH